MRDVAAGAEQGRHAAALHVGVFRQAHRMPLIEPHNISITDARQASLVRP
jgi:hypothetical protein